MVKYITKHANLPFFDLELGAPLRGSSQAGLFLSQSVSEPNF